MFPVSSIKIYIFYVAQCVFPSMNFRLMFVLCLLCAQNLQSLSVFLPAPLVYLSSSHSVPGQLCRSAQLIHYFPPQTLLQNKFLNSLTSASDLCTLV